MTLTQYQKRAKETAIYPNNPSYMGIVYTAIGLAGEAGEVANKVKKMLRDHNNILTPALRQEIKDELGDVLWYVANLADEICADLDGVATANLEKLEDRQKRGALHGKGDKR